MISGNAPPRRAHLRRASTRSKCHRPRPSTCRSMLRHEHIRDIRIRSARSSCARRNLRVAVGRLQTARQHRTGHLRRRRGRTRSKPSMRRCHPRRLVRIVHRTTLPFVRRGRIHPQRPDRRFTCAKGRLVHPNRRTGGRHGKRPDRAMGIRRRNSVPRRAHHQRHCRRNDRPACAAADRSPRPTSPRRRPRRPAPQSPAASASFCICVQIPTSPALALAKHFAYCSNKRPLRPPTQTCDSRTSHASQTLVI